MNIVKDGIIYALWKWIMIQIKDMQVSQLIAYLLFES